MLDLRNKTVLVTGAAGFIGSHLVTRLLREFPETRIVGVDNLNDYYEPALKQWRLEQISKVGGNWRFMLMDIADKQKVAELFQIFSFDVVVNLAAQAGVRYSIDHPDAYMQSNVEGFYNILEACRYAHVAHLVYASSSSVYGNQEKVPYSTDDNVDHPISLYAATKKANELFAYTYAHLYGIPSTGLRFFTVYGPAGRPDMAYFKFTQKLERYEKIQLYNYGNCRRDFTYIDDIVEGIVRVIQQPPSMCVPYKIYNIGNSHPEDLMTFVDILQQELMRAGVLSFDHDLHEYIELDPAQPGDVEQTFADVSELERDFGYKPKTSLRDGLRKFAEWYKEYYSNPITL